ncbi:MAG TPA: aminotransferase [Acidimicrobiaceae bacterium]|nr:aminotransferase [Acidimicrobiaceae bacterium]
MSLSHGRPLVMIPGPSVMPDEVLAAMHRPMPNIYEGDIVDLTYRMLDELPPIARTRHRAYITVSNGHGAWEMAVTNTLSRGDHVLVLEAGHFATGWASNAAKSGVTYDVLTAERGAAVSPDAFAERLAADAERRIDAVFVAHVDTATSVRNDIAAVRKVLDDADHPALLMVDCVASLACEPYEMDAWGVDVTVSGSQKGLMVPPGLGFVWASPRAQEAHKTADLRTGYWDWTARTDPDAHYWIFCGTPPVQHLWGLEVALAMLAEEGLEAAWRRHDVMAGAVHAAVDAWAAPDGLSLHVADPAHRANSVTVIDTGSVDAERLRATAERQAGLTLGRGIHVDTSREVRIGHMGHLNPPMLLGCLGTVEASLAACGAPLGGSGVAAAAAELAKAMEPSTETLGPPLEIAPSAQGPDGCCTSAG